MHCRQGLSVSTYGQLGSTNDNEDALVSSRNAKRITRNLIFVDYDYVEIRTYPNHGNLAYSNTAFQKLFFVARGQKLSKMISV